MTTCTPERIARFLGAKHALGRSPRTIETYRERLGAFARWAGDRPLDRATLRAYLAHLQQQPLSDTSRAAYARDVAVFVRFLVEEGELDADPTTKLTPSTPKLLPASYTPEQIRALLGVCDARDRAIIITLLDTGLRASELLSMTRDRIDWQTGRFTVIGKGAKPRACWLGVEARAAVRSYLSTRRDATPWLWLAHHGTPLTRNGLYQVLKRRCIQAGIRGDVRRIVHALRATFARTYLKEGGDLETLAKLLGHSSLAMAAFYAQLNDEELGIKKGRIDPLGAIIGTKKTEQGPTR